MTLHRLMIRKLEERYPEGKLLPRSEEHTSELQSRQYLVCRLLLEKKNISRLIRRQPAQTALTASAQDLILTVKISHDPSHSPDLNSCVLPSLRKRLCTRAPTACA